MTQIEILAPVGSEEMLRAAVYSGADAVYLGFAGFNARSGAGNFDAASLCGAVRFCHGRGVRVHVAMNTTVYAGELEALAAAVRAVAASGADAVICQDMATAGLCRRIAPELPRHASTQMSVHTLEGALEMAELGFARVILARELSLAEIETIARGCGIETECFVHGALCMSMSGQCYMSAFLGGRSGNRGSCAGPCRLPFDAAPLPEGRPGKAHHLSLKDNSVIGQLDKLQAVGVASAKIEGRLRTPEYVAAAVDACLAGREGRAYDRAVLQNAFSRSGFTSGYLDGRIDGSMFGTRTEADAAETRRTLPALRELYRRERPRVPVDLKLEVEAEGEKLTAADREGNRAIVYGETAPQPALTDPAAALRRSLGKTGGTPFAPGEIEIDMKGGPWYLPGSAVNELRRQALEALLQKRETLRPWPVRPAELTILELPRAMFGGMEADTIRRVEAARGQGFAGFEANNIAHLRIGRGLPLTGGIGLNLTNPLAAQVYAELGLSALLVLPEVQAGEMAFIAPVREGRPVPTGALIYGHMPLMLTRACPLHNLHDCAHCSREGELTDRKAKKFPVRCGGGVRTIYNPVPLYMGDKPGALPVDYGVAYFTLESREEAAAVLGRIARGEPFEGDFTRGLYYKGTL